MMQTTDTEVTYKELYFDLVKKYNELKEECENWKQALCFLDTTSISGTWYLSKNDYLS